jgi:hypothetical protein
MDLDLNFIVYFLDTIFLQIEPFGIRKGPLGSANPIITGVIPSPLGVIGISILINFFNAGIRRKLIDQTKITTNQKGDTGMAKRKNGSF